MRPTLLLVDRSLTVLATSSASGFEDAWIQARSLFLGRTETAMLLLVIEDPEYGLFELRGNQVLSEGGYHPIGRVAARYNRGTIHYVDRG